MTQEPYDEAGTSLAALAERLEDALDRRSIREREGVTMSFEKVAAELGL